MYGCLFKLSNQNDTLLISLILVLVTIIFRFYFSYHTFNIVDFCIKYCPVLLIWFYFIINVHKILR